MYNKTDKINTAKIYGNYLIDYYESNKNDINNYYIRNDIKSIISLSEENNYDITEYMTSLLITNNYDESFTTIIELVCKLPSKIALEIIKAYEISYEQLIVVLNFEDISLTYSSVYTENILNGIVNSIDSLNSFNKNPYNGISFKIVNLNYTINTNNLNTNSNANDSVDDLRIVFNLIPEVALSLSRTEIPKSITGNSTDDYIDNLLAITKLFGNQLVTFKEPSHNTLKYKSIISLKNKLIDILNDIDNNYGVYTFGIKSYIEGKYLYIADNNKDLLQPATDIYLEIMDSITLTAFDKVGYVYKNNYYFVINEKDVNIFNNDTSVMETYGNEIEVKYKGKSALIELPNSLKKKNLNTLTTNKKIYVKETDAAFFETKILREIADNSLTIEVNLTDVDYNLFHIGKHIVLHYYNQIYAAIYNGEYKVTFKEVYFTMGKNSSLYTTNVRLVLKRIIPEFTYNNNDLLYNTLYTAKDIIDTASSITDSFLSWGQDKTSNDYILNKIMKQNNIKQRFNDLYGGIEMGDLSKHFNLKQFVFSPTAVKYGLNNNPTAEHKQNIINLCTDVLDVITDKIKEKNSTFKLNINSGYRSAELNKLIGGSSSTSQHMTGQAADIICNNMTVIDLFNVIKDGIPVFDQLIFEYNSWIHVGYIKSTTKVAKGKNRKQILIAFGQRGSGLKTITLYRTYNSDETKYGTALEQFNAWNKLFQLNKNEVPNELPIKNS